MISRDISRGISRDISREISRDIHFPLNFAQAQGKKNTKSRQEDSDESSSTNEDEMLDVTKFARGEAISLKDEQGKTLSLRFYILLLMPAHLSYCQAGSLRMAW